MICTRHPEFHGQPSRKKALRLFTRKGIYDQERDRLRHQGLT